MTLEELTEILDKHELWLKGNIIEGKQAELEGANLKGLSFKGRNLRFARIRHSNLKEADLESASFNNANFYGSNLTGANLSNAFMHQGSFFAVNFTKANLSGANLTAASLNYSVGNTKEIKSFQLCKHCVVYTADYLAIGQQRAPIKEWEKAVKNRYIASLLVGKNGCEDDLWWEANKDFILDLITRYPATPTGHEGKK